MGKYNFNNYDNDLLKLKSQIQYSAPSMDTDLNCIKWRDLFTSTMVV